MRFRFQASTNAFPCNARFACEPTHSPRIPLAITSVWFVTSSLTSTTATLRSHSTSALPRYTPVSPCASTQVQPLKIVQHTSVFPFHFFSDVAELLLDQGADIAAINGRGDTALHLAAAGGFARVTVILLARGAAVDAVSTMDGDTPLHRAAAAGHTEVVRLLVGQGLMSLPRMHRENRLGSLRI